MSPSERFFERALRAAIKIVNIAYSFTCESPRRRKVLYALNLKPDIGKPGSNLAGREGSKGSVFAQLVLRGEGYWFSRFIYESKFVRSDFQQILVRE